MLFKIGDNVRIKSVALILAVILIILTTSCSCTRDQGRHAEPDKGPAGVEQGSGGEENDGGGGGEEDTGRDDNAQHSADDDEDGAGNGDLDGLLEEMLDIQTLDFTLEDLEGEEISLFDLRGRIVMLNFWATWCSSCVMGLPDIQALYEEYKDGEDLAVLTVNLTVSEDRSIPSQYRGELDGGQWVEKFIQDKGYTFPVLLDREGEAAYKYSAISIPTTFFIDRDGIIRYIHPGPMSKDDIMYYINNIKKLDEL